jgi:hypothetical protein
VTTLTALDRCDGCSARALTVATKPEHTDLLLCGHHTHVNRVSLIAKGWFLIEQVPEPTAVPTAQEV